MDKFEDLEVFKRAYRVSLDIHCFTQSLPPNEHMVWGTRFGGPLNRSAPILPKVSASRGSPRPNFGVSFR